MPRRASPSSEETPSESKPGDASGETAAASDSRSAPRPHLFRALAQAKHKRPLQLLHTVKVGAAHLLQSSRVQMLTALSLAAAPPEPSYVHLPGGATSAPRRAGRSGLVLRSAAAS